jgi:hypothetical protein
MITKEFREHVKKNCVPGASEIIRGHGKRDIYINELLSELEAYTDGRAYDKENGLPWKHWLEHSSELIEKIRSELTSQTAL